MDQQEWSLRLACRSPVRTPLPNNTINAAPRRLGHARGETTGRRFRALAL